MVQVRIGESQQPEVDSPSEHVVALALAHRKRLSGQHGLVQTAGNTWRTTYSLHEAQAAT